MNDYTEQAIELLNQKYAELIKVGSIDGFNPDIDAKIYKLGIHLREIDNAKTNIVAMNYAGDTNLSRMWDEQLDIKIERAMEWLSQCG